MQSELDLQSRFCEIAAEDGSSLVFDVTYLRRSVASSPEQPLSVPATTCDTVNTSVQDPTGITIF